MEDSIFTKIIRGEIPCHKVYEDQDTLAFLVIPKKQVQFVWDLSLQDYHAVMATTQKVALRLREVLKTTYVGEQIVGVDVPHAHVQLIPFNTSVQYHAIPDMGTEPNHNALAAMANRLLFPVE
jgi:histidine triad (HIT) family protein